MANVEKNLEIYKIEVEKRYIQNIDNLINDVLKLLKVIDFIDTKIKEYLTKTNTTDFVSV